MCSQMVIPLYERVIKPPLEMLFIGSESNRTIEGNHAIWDTCHDAASGNLGAWHDDPWYRIIAGAQLTATYWIQRAFLFFDTSGLPSGAKIVGARLSLYTIGADCTSAIDYPHLCITQGVQDDPVVSANYGDQLPYTSIGGQVDLRDLVADQYNEIVFNDSGLAWINKTGTTKLCIRQQMDIIDHAPPLGSNQSWWYSAQKGTGYKAKLTVLYR